MKNSVLALGILALFSFPLGCSTPREHWHENGVIMARGQSFLWLFRTGDWTYWYNNGQKYSEGEYSRRKTGFWTSWHKNGVKKKEGEYEDGKREGPWTYWNEDGSINSEKSGIYKNGKKVPGLL